jgi:serine/threonine protein kinase
MSPTSIGHFIQAVREVALLSPSQIAELDKSLGSQFDEPKALAGEMLRRGWLTSFQVNLLLQGRGSQLVLGAYVLLERLGEGGTGQVFKARHQRMNRVVAIKVIRRELLADAEVVQRFYREIETISCLSHPNIVHAFDAGPVGPVHMLVMEYVEGIDLARLVKQSGPLPVERACNYLCQAALGLQHAHERGLIHRDIKPSNLLLTEGSGQPPLIKLLDLGLARLQRKGDGELTAVLTPVGAVTMGTPDYLAPEQAIDFHHVDIRADIYGLGCALFYLLTGQPPFPGGSLAQKLLRHQQAEPPLLEQLRPGLPATLRPIMDRMLAKSPGDRYQAPVDVAEALCRVSSAPGGAEAVMPRPPLTETLSDTPRLQETVKQPVLMLAAGRWRKRRWLAAGAAAAVAVLIALVIGLTLPGGPRTGEQARQPTTSAGEITSASQPSKLLFADDFAGGKASSAWIFTPPKGYWSVSGGRLIASGPTIHTPGPEHENAYLPRLPAGVASFEVDIEAPVPRAAIGMWTRNGKAGLCYGAGANNALEWGTWDKDNGKDWSGWSNAGVIEGGKVHTYKITLDPDGAIALWLDGKMRTGGIRLGPAADWKNGIPEVSLYTEGNAKGMVLGARFSNVRALAR